MPRASSSLFIVGGVALAGLVAGAGAVHYGLPLVQSSSATAECMAIKGNISSTGERVYHVPGHSRQCYLAGPANFSLFELGGD